MDKILSDITVKTDNNLRDSSFIFIDTRLKENDCQHFLEDLQRITDQNILTFDNIDFIYQSDQIKSTIRIFLIISGSLEQTLKTQLNQIANIQFIYVFHRDLTKHRMVMLCS